MKKFWKIFGIIVLSIVLIAYLAFLFVLPNVIDLNQYKSMLKQIVKEQVKLDVDFQNAKIITTPLLGVGVKVDNIAVKYEDNTELFKADSIKTRVALPSLLLFTVKVSCLEVENPYVNLQIEDGKNLKILQHIDKILTEQEKTIVNESEPTKPALIDVSKIRIKIPSAKLINYTVLADDKINKHNLSISGDELILGYFNGKVAKIKTNVKILSDNEQKISALIDINTFIPPATQLDEEDDKMHRAELPYANIVEMYRTYDLKVNADTKLKIREKNGAIKLWGYANIDNLSLKLADYILPESYFHAKFKAQKAIIDTDLSVAENQNVKLLGLVNFSKHPKINLFINSDKIYFKSIISFVEGVFDTLQIKNNLASIVTSGYFEANTNIKTNFKKLKSNGKIIVREGGFVDKTNGFAIENGNADIDLDNNILCIKNAGVLIDNIPLTFEGSIDEKSVANLKIKTEKLPLKGLYNTFAPQDLKQVYTLNSGDLSLNINLTGELKKAILSLNTVLENLSVSDKLNTLIVFNKKAVVDLKANTKELKGVVNNKGLKISLPQTKSFIKNEDLNINIDEKNIIVEPSKLLINENSVIDYKADIFDWSKQRKIKIDFIADGKLNTRDLKQFLGEQAAIFISEKGIIPLNLSYVGNGKRQDLLVQMGADSNNFITPINISSIYGKPSVLQAKVAFKGNRLKVKETGLFEKITVIDEKTGEAKILLNEILGLEGTLVNLNSNPFINLFTVRIPKDLNISINGFKKADLIFGGKLFAFGNASSPRFRGGFYVKNLNIQDLLMTMEKTDLVFAGKHLNLNLQNLILNGSDIAVKSRMSLEPSKIFIINNLEVVSKTIDVDKMLKVVDLATKLVPPAKSQPAIATTPSEIPVKIEKGNIDISFLKTGAIKVNEIYSKIELLKNIFYLNDLSARAFYGSVSGDISMNLLNNMLHIKMNGKNINADKAATDAAGMKNTISGVLAFDADLALNAMASNYQEQMKSLLGTVDFSIKNGQLGPFGKLENMIVAENIRESSFFQSALGGVISNLTTIDTTHFDKMQGHVTLKDAIVGIYPITSDGNVLNLYIFGNMDLIKNELDMKVRVKLGSEISNMLGPIAALNPINLVKATPGLNVAMAKTFALFCEEVSADEMALIPMFDDKMAEFYATKFQINLRGDVAKPLTLIKAFKWLVTSSEMAAAETFVASLPDPVVTEDGQILQTAEEIQAYHEYNNKRSTKFKKAVKKFFTPEKKDEEKTREEVIDENLTE